MKTTVDQAIARYEQGERGEAKALADQADGHKSYNPAANDDGAALVKWHAIFNVVFV